MSLHIVRDGETVLIRPDGDDYADMMFQVCKAMELSIEDGDCSIYPMVTTSLRDKPGAIATIEEGNRIIIYDRRLSPEVGYFGALGIIAHEIGHHYCRHFNKRRGHRLELEADRFAGAAMRRANYSLQQTLAMVSVLEKRPSFSHPGRNRRQNALKEGWTNPAVAKTCR